MLCQYNVLLSSRSLTPSNANITYQVDADSNFDWLTELGFSTLHSYEEVNCDAATWTMVPGP